jgi:hypothetical protein
MKPEDKGSPGLGSGNRNRGARDEFTGGATALRVTDGGGLITCPRELVAREFARSRERHLNVSGIHGTLLPMMRRLSPFQRFVTLLSLASAAVTGTAMAKNPELIRNGDFSSGLANWTVLASDGGVVGSFTAAAVGAVTPRSNDATPANPAGGALYALADQNNKSYQVLAQTFRVPRSTKRVLLSYQMFAHSGAATVLNPALFDIVGANQQARVDLLKGGSALMATSGIAKVLYNRGADAVASATPPPFTTYRLNLTRKVKAGRTYTIRFLAAATEEVMKLGVDNVSVKAR